MSKKKIEPTDAMVDWAANILCLDATHTSLRFHAGLAQQAYRKKARAVMRTALSLALNHPDAAGLFAGEDDRPWEPLVRYHPLNVGDEVRQERAGITTTAVVGRVDDGGDPWTDAGDPWTDGGALIGLLRHGTWYVRRPIQGLPEADGAVIVPADGREYIETRTGKKSRRLTWDAECLVWYDARGTHLRGDITPDTWKEDDQ